MNATPADKSPGITGFIEIFEGRLNKMKLHLKEELSKAKGERDRKAIRRIEALNLIINDFVVTSDEIK